VHPITIALMLNAHETPHRYERISGQGWPVPVDPGDPLA
jgi:hypothetical protein